MTITIPGGDGVCGWPNALDLSNRGYILDTFGRRESDLEREVESPIRPIGERLRVWKGVTGNGISFHTVTVGERDHRRPTLFEKVRERAEKFADRCDRSTIRCVSLWI